MRLTHCLSIATLSLALLGAGRANAQTDEEKAAARSLATQGADALRDKRYADAVDLLTRAEAVIHAPPHLLLTARAQVGLGRLVAARESYLKVVREELPAGAPSAFKRAQQEAKDELAALEPRIASLRIAVTGPGAGDMSKVTVKLDDQPVTSALVGVHRPIDPGKHVVSANATGRDPVKQEVTLGDGEKKDVSLELKEGPLVEGPSAGAGPTTNPGVTPDAGKGSGALRIAGIAAMGVGGAGLVVGGVFTGLWASKSADADAAFNACTATACTAEQRAKVSDLDDQAASRGTIAIIGLAAGGAVAGAGLALFLVSNGNKAEGKPAGAMVVPFVTPNGAGLVGRF
ncbi:hypothetical protein [Polyangium aurulentum]|uniref:hypothetical protein n=1 Tax=Polyangium aurulentum TaxID=2567896 RepID=UPI0010AE4D03|nr:hypothetical protein [Polyangium aurulentum]UQA56626.1 hypothetical protein E8A73_035760 [Polyangium aurulentum]